MAFLLCRKNIPQGRPQQEQRCCRLAACTFERHFRIGAALPSKLAVRCATMFTVLNMFD
jgi:hypothetical protein